MRRSLVLLPLPIIAGIVLTLAFTQPLSAYSPLLQASETPPPGPVTLLPLNETVTGELDYAGEITYTFDVPVGQDIVIATEADKVVLASYCMEITTPSSEYGDCYGGGGGGGDGPISTVFVIPATNVPDARQTVEMTLTRPLDGLASYRLTAYPITPQVLALGQSMPINPVVSQPFQLYALDTEPNQLFTVQIEEDSVEGDFLWVAAYPPFLGDGVTLSEERQLFLQTLDYAFREDNPDGMTQLMLYYLGGNSFRVLVKATVSYALHPASLQMQSLDERTELTLTVSYQAPVQIIRLDTHSGDAVEINIQVTDGTGAQVAVYAEDRLMGGNYLSLGTSSKYGPFPLSDTIERAVDTDVDLVVIVHIPLEFTRSQATVKVEWARKE